MPFQFRSSVALDDQISANRIYSSVADNRGSRQSTYRTAGKIVFDYALILMALPLILPLIGLCALLVAMRGGTPFYRQERIGKDGRVFRILKLRTMVLKADEVLEDYLASNPEARREWDDKQKLYHDPRITKVGSFLRKTSLDELPQLWNVLKGEMSLIGPRPMMPSQERLYSGTAYYRLRPGITGLWQVSARNEGNFSDRVFFDTTYYQKLSLKLDVSIFFRTIGVVLRGTGY